MSSLRDTNLGLLLKETTYTWMLIKLVNLDSNRFDVNEIGAETITEVFRKTLSFSVVTDGTVILVDKHDKFCDAPILILHLQELSRSQVPHT